MAILLSRSFHLLVYVLKNQAASQEMAPGLHPDGPNRSLPEIQAF